MYKSRFLYDFVDLNVAMWTSNNALTPDPNKEPDALTSSPYEWPLASVGLRMCSWDDNTLKFYLLGHPLIWWGSAGALVLFVLTVLTYIVRLKRQIDNWAPGKSISFECVS